MSMWGFSFGMASMAASGIRLTAAGSLGLVGPCANGGRYGFPHLPVGGHAASGFEGRLLVRPN